MLVRSRPLAGPVPALDHSPEVAWISADIDLFGWGAAKRIGAGTGADRLARVAEAFEEWCAEAVIEDQIGVPGSGPVVFGSFGFDSEVAGSVAVVPEVTIGRRQDRWWATVVDDADHTPYLHPAGTRRAQVDRPRYAGSSMPDVMWLEAVADAIDAIEAGEVEKVVLARDYALWSKAPFDRRLVLERLAARFPECFTFLVEGLVGASPELLVRRLGRRVESIPLAGSAARSPDPGEDERLAKELLTSDKIQREHEAAAASVAAGLGEVCAQLERSDPELLSLANLQHLATRFSGTLRDNQSALELAGTLHPTAAVGGAPTGPALALIRRLEGMQRGRYAGPVGWMDRHGDGEWAIALRCAELSGARARLFAGSGIVAGSLPEDELEETRLKLAAMLEALQP